MVRKSPIRHSVRKHRREGYTVHSYIRGKGSRPTNPFVRRRVIEHFSRSHEPRKYYVNYTYLDKSTEEITTTARSPAQALRFGNIKRNQQTLRPTEVVIKNSIGEIVKKIGFKLGETGKKTAVRLKKEMKLLPTRVRQVAKESYRLSKQAVIKADEKIQERAENWWTWKMARPILLRCQSSDLATRVRALQELRRKYPQIYIDAGFGKAEEVYGPPKEVVKPTPYIS